MHLRGWPGLVRARLPCATITTNAGLSIDGSGLYTRQSGV